MHPSILKINTLAAAADVVVENRPDKSRKISSRRAEMILAEIDSFKSVERQHLDNVKQAARGTVIAFSIAGMLVPTAGAMITSCRSKMSKEDKISCYTNLVGALASLAGATIAAMGIREFRKRRTHLTEKIDIFDSAMARRLQNAQGGQPNVVMNFFSQYEELSKEERETLIAEIQAKI